MTTTQDVTQERDLSGPDVTLHELFEAQARRTPDAVAVVTGDVALRYRDLDQRANQLAWYLLGQGVGLESRVAIRMGRPAALVGLLGVLKAGAVYVPLDPNYPAERTSVMLDDPEMDLLLTDEPLAADVVPPHVRMLKYTPDVASGHPATAPQSEVTSANLAYVFYTSGSTGRPKGVMVSHQAVVNHTLWFQQQFRLGPDDRLLHKTPIGFDPSVTEFMAPLIAGGQLIFAPDYAHRDPASLVGAVIRHQVTVLQVVPTLLRLLLDQRELSQCRSLRLLISGGEALSTDLVERAGALLAAEVYNLYGPTEAAIDVTCLNVAEPSDQAIMPIGRPISQTSVHVLDAGLRPRPDGEIGELYIGGIALARGYAGRPDLTAERFVPDPFTDGDGPAGRRLYRTGDLGRYRPDGVLEYAGRADQQLKIRGVRIEPGDVEAALRKHPGVNDAAVVAEAGPAGDQQLVAYVATTRPGNGAGLASGLREHLARQLPSYLVPTVINEVDELPRTPNGKLDRRRLPAATAAAPAAAGSRPPRDELERELAEKFASLLGLQRLGVDDHLFDQGADSLTVARLGTHVMNTYDAKLPLFLLFSDPTVAGVAETIRSYDQHGETETVTKNTSLMKTEAELDPTVIPDWRV